MLFSKPPALPLCDLVFQRAIHEHLSEFCARSQPKSYGWTGIVKGATEGRGELEEKLEEKTCKILSGESWRIRSSPDTGQFPAHLRVPTLWECISAVISIHHPSQALQLLCISPWKLGNHLFSLVCILVSRISSLSGSQGLGFGDEWIYHRGKLKLQGTVLDDSNTCKVLGKLNIFIWLDMYGVNLLISLALQIVINIFM